MSFRTIHSPLFTYLINIPRVCNEHLNVVVNNEPFSVGLKMKKKRESSYQNIVQLTTCFLTVNLKKAVFVVRLTVYLTTLYKNA